MIRRQLLGCVLIYHWWSIPRIFWLGAMRPPAPSTTTSDYDHLFLERPRPTSSCRSWSITVSSIITLVRVENSFSRPPFRHGRTSSNPEHNCLPVPRIQHYIQCGKQKHQSGYLLARHQHEQRHRKV